MADSAGTETPEAVVELVANVDDATAEVLAHAAAALLRAGAVDAWLTPIVMKKGRAATQVSALVRPEDAERLSLELIRQTGSFGVRSRAWDRLVVERSQHRVDTVYGEVSIKFGKLHDETLFARPEADSAAEVAAAAGVPFRVVMLAAEAAGRSLLSAGPAS